jgi:hypothetical protein
MLLECSANGRNGQRLQLHWVPAGVAAGIVQPREERLQMRIEHHGPMEDRNWAGSEDLLRCFVDHASCRVHHPIAPAPFDARPTGMDNSRSDQRNRSARHIESAPAVIDESLATAVDHAHGVLFVEVPVEALAAKIGAQE